MKIGKKGLYSGTIALIAIVIASGIVLGMLSKAIAEENKSSINEMAYVKFEWQNAYQLIGKASADAAADGVFGNGCVFSIPAIQAKAQAYLPAVLASTGLNCTVSNITAGGTAAETAITFDLSCSKEAAGMSIKYAKNGMISKKTVFTQGGGLNPCFVDVKDFDSGACQVDKIAPPGC